MVLSAGRRLGAYEILSAIGAGGMGEVWKARDTTLGRDVALKILPDHLALEPDRLARFKREAQILGSLNHPNIATIHGFQQSEGVQALVLELVEGLTLADRIAQGPIPLEEALPIARQIAEALEAAHEQGIIHRDLKPANIKLRPDGTVKVLDFGLAKALGDNASTSNLSMSPTITSPALMTAGGVILGTAAYMSPEQARGKSVDKRADIWAFGCVVYEMLTGRAAFEGDTVGETLASVFKTEPEWTRMPATTPSGIRRLLRRCLQKDPALRLRDIGDAGLELIDAQREPATNPDVSNLPRRRERLAWASSGVVVGALAVAALGWAMRPAPVPVGPEMRFEIDTPSGAPLNLAISPDGRFLAFVGMAPGGNSLWVRSLDSTDAKPLAGTEGGPLEPFWSPDSRYIGFYAEGKLKKVAISGGPVETLCDAPGFAGASWNQQNVILFSSSSILKRIDAGGGEPQAITELDPRRQETAHQWPFFLPDGVRFLFLAQSSDASNRAAYAASLGSSDRIRILPSESKVLYTAAGYLIFHRAGTLIAQRFDADRFEILADPIRLADNVAVNTTGRGAFSAAENGTLVYRAGGVAQTTQLIWFDRSGKQLAVASPTGQYGDLELSLDDRFVALEQAAPGGDIWVLDLGNGVISRVTSDPARDADPVWSPDGRTLAFRSDRDGGNLYQRAFAAIGNDTLLMKNDVPKDPSDWSHDGRYLTYEVAGDIWALPLFGDRRPERVTTTTFGEANSRISPDGRWIAYQSNESGAVNVYVQAFLRPGPKQPVSTNGGAQPRWSHDGKELFYLSPTSTLMAVSVKTSDITFDVSAPVPLFDSPIGAGEGNYTVSSDGRFLLNVPVERGLTIPVTVILNWARQQR